MGGAPSMGLEGPSPSLVDKPWRKPHGRQFSKALAMILKLNWVKTGASSEWPREERRTE